MTRRELDRHDGREGRRAYVAVSGRIYDVTGSPLWLGGEHEGVHRAGTDLTVALTMAPHVRAVIERFPVIGELEGKPAAWMKVRWLLVWLVLAIVVGGLLYWLLR